MCCISCSRGCIESDFFYNFIEPKILVIAALSNEVTNHNKIGKALFKKEQNVGFRLRRFSVKYPRLHDLALENYFTMKKLWEIKCKQKKFQSEVIFCLHDKVAIETFARRIIARLKLQR